MLSNGADRKTLAHQSCQISVSLAALGSSYSEHVLTRLLERLLVHARQLGVAAKGGQHLHGMAWMCHNGVHPSPTQQSSLAS